MQHVHDLDIPYGADSEKMKRRNFKMKFIWQGFIIIYTQHPVFEKRKLNYNISGSLISDVKKNIYCAIIKGQRCSFDESDWLLKIQNRWYFIIFFRKYIHTTTCILHIKTGCCCLFKTLDDDKDDIQAAHWQFRCLISIMSLGCILSFKPHYQLLM